MDKEGRKPGGALARWAGQHRRKLWTAGVLLVIYTLTGFFFVPWLVQKLAVDTVRERFGSTLTIDAVAFNPYVLGLRIDGLLMRDPEGQNFIGAQQIYVNLQLSSLFRFAPTFAEIRLDGPEVRLERDAGGALNTAFLLQKSETEPASAPEPDQSRAQPPRLIVHDFAINDAVLRWRDEVPEQPVETIFGPVDVRISNLNTLPEKEGQQDVVIRTETAGVLSWKGSLQLNPLRSAGRAQVLGSHMPLVSAYIREAAGFELVRGDADLGFDYALETMPGGGIQARIDNAQLALRDILVRTFGAATSAGQANDRDVLVLPDLSIRGGSMRWPEQSVEVDDFEISDAAVSMYRDAAGALNIVPRREQKETAPEPPMESDVRENDNGADWSVSLGRFSINRMSVALVDDSVQPQADMGIDDLTLTVSDISTIAGARFPVEATVLTRSGGTVQVDGEIGVLPAPVAELTIAASELSLAESHPYIQPLADVNLDSGHLGLNASVTSNADDAFAFAGDVTISDFLITETDEGSRLGSWERLLFSQVAVSVAQRSIRVSEVRFDKPYADVFVAADGSVNLGRIEPGKQMPKRGQAEAAQPVATAEQAEAAASNGTAVQPRQPAFDVTIGRVVVADAAADFADFSLPLPFEAGIAALNGQVTTIATGSAEPSTVDMEGKVDDFGLLRVSGSITPLNVSKNTDVRLRFENVEIPKFSAYTVAFAGREIASGKLDLDLGYAVTDNELMGENRVLLRDFTLGDKVEHPGAMSLPLGLAVALLKGPDGNIDIDLPVRGNVNDPEFGYGRVIGKALVNLIVKIAASPFALLGNLVGVAADELDHVAFIAGRADLTPPEQERIANIGQALALRPELVLEVSGVVDGDADGLALKTARLDELVEARIDASDETYDVQRTRVIEALFRETVTLQEGGLDELRARFVTSATDPESGATTSGFDALAYTGELRRRLIEQQTVTEAELAALATARADSVRTALVATDVSLAERIRMGQQQAVEADENGGVRMDVTLTTRGN